MNTRNLFFQLKADNMNSGTDVEF